MNVKIGETYRYEKNFLAGNSYNTSEVKTAVHRLTFVIIAFILSFSIIIYRLVDITIMDEDSSRVYSSNNDNGNFSDRAEIVDRNGVLLAINLVTASLYANPKIIDDPIVAAEKLVKVLPSLDKKNIIEKLSSDTSFVWLKRNLTPNQQYAVNGLGIPGFAFERAEKRFYPKGTLFSHVLGYVGIDGKGLSGIEKEFDNELRTSNKTIELSLDTRLQTIMHNNLSYAVDKFSAKAAAGIIMDAKSGEVLSLVSLPDFNPHYPSKANEEEKFNRATLGVYEMGSTFKTFTMAMALDSKSISINDLFDVSKPIRKSGFLIRDSHPEKGVMSVPQIYMKSSNIGTAKIISKVGIKKQKEYMEKLGLFSPLNIEIPEKSTPIVPAKWSEINSLTISYGHGIAVTLVHLAKAISTVINGGVANDATLVKKDNNLDFWFASYKGDKVIDDETSKLMRSLMYMTVEKGTGKKAKVDGYLVGGKTGTAEKPVNGRYDRKAMISSFVGAFPIDDPKYVVIVMLDEPKGIKETFGYATGGMTAAPIVGKVIENIGPVLLLKRSMARSNRRDNYINFNSKKEGNNATF